MKKIKAFKSTILGLIMLGFAAYLLIEEVTQDKTILGALFVVGIGLLFSGDKFIERLELAVFGRIPLKKKDDERVE